MREHFLAGLALRRSNSVDRRKLSKRVPGIFGVPLHTSIQYANVAVSLLNEDGHSYIYGYVPIVMAKTSVYLKEKSAYDNIFRFSRCKPLKQSTVALEVENIFATGSSPLRIQELQVTFDSPDRYGKSLDWSCCTAHDAANILLRYLLRLPEPVIPLE
jgi:hypothetical protein